MDDCLKETSSVPFSPFSDSAHSTWVSATERVRTGKRWKDSAAERVEITIPVYHYLLLKNETPRRRSIRRSRNGQAIYTVGSIFRAVRPVYTLRLSSRRIGYLTRERERERERAECCFPGGPLAVTHHPPTAYNLHCGGIGYLYLLYARRISIQLEMML